jgi:hypothetical protein
LKRALFAQQLARSRRAGPQHAFEALAIERRRGELPPSSVGGLHVFRKAHQPLLELAHAQRKKAAAGRRVELADSEFLCQLAALALLGEALFGRLVRVGDAAASRDFRHRLARLLTESR